LHDALLAHVLSLGATNILAHFAQNDDGERFAHAHGFERAKSAPISRVDPRTVTLDIPNDPEFHVVSFADVRHRPRDVFELDAVGALDEPSVNPHDDMRYNDWERAEWQHPDLEFDGSTVVLSRNQMVAFTWLRVDAERGRGLSAFTATRPEFRGRGLATRAKLRTARWAAEHGVTSITTANDDSNAAMLAVNRRIGFAPIGSLLTYQRNVTAPSHS
jgi:RimJ/RimL family protein N-acetyltransferase